MSPPAIADAGNMRRAREHRAWLDYLNNQVPDPDAFGGVIVIGAAVFVARVVTLGRIAADCGYRSPDGDRCGARVAPFVFPAASRICPR